MKDQLVNEKELVELAKTDDRAFGELYEFYFPKIYGYIFKRLGNRADTEDIVSSIFLKVFANLKKYPSESMVFGAFIFRVATNTLIDFYRRHGRKKEFSLEAAYPGDDGESESLDLPDPAADPQARAILSEERSTVISVLNKLSGNYQKILQLRFFAELEHEEIAEVMKITVNNARVLLHRALKKFHENYQKYVSK